MSPGFPPPGCLSREAGWRCPTASPNLFKGVLRHLPGLMPPTLTAETPYPTAFVILVTILTVAITPCIVLASISISSVPQWLRLARCGSLLWLLHHHPQLHNLFFQTHDVIFTLCLSQYHSDSFPESVLLLRFSLIDNCNMLRVHYP